MNYNLFYPQQIERSFVNVCKMSETKKVENLSMELRAGWLTYWNIEIAFKWVHFNFVLYQTGKHNAGSVRLLNIIVIW